MLTDVNQQGSMLTPRWTQLRHHPMQSRLWRTKERDVKVCAGRGSGKTEIARRRTVRYLRIKKPWNDPRYFYALPTYAQCYRVARSHILSLIPRQWFTKVPGDSQMEFKFVFGSWLFLVGMDKPERVEGDQYDGGVVDESSDQKPGIYARTLRPALTHRQGWLWRIGVPKRFGRGAGEFRSAFDSGLLGHDSFWWPSWDILSPEEIAELQSELDEKDYNEQIGGRWEDAGGAAYYNFLDVDVHSDNSLGQNAGNVDSGIAYRPDSMIYVGTDFNVDPMAWVLGHLTDRTFQLVRRWEEPSGEGFIELEEIVGEVSLQCLEIFDEVWRRNTNTPEQLDKLHARYPDHRGGWTFTGDASSRKRQTSASRTDYSHIANDRRFNARLLVNKQNPAVKDRLACVNHLAKSQAGHRRLFIHPRCQHLRTDLKTRSLNEYGEPEPSESLTSSGKKDSGHATDALGYLVHRYFPINLAVNSGNAIAHVKTAEELERRPVAGIITPASKRLYLPMTGRSK